jgi:hypothetical protein
MSKRFLCVVLLVVIGAAIVAYGFNFGRKPRPNTNDDITGITISSLGSALIGLGVGLHSKNPKLIRMLPFVFALAYLPFAASVIWTGIVFYAIWRAAFG